MQNTPTGRGNNLPTRQASFWKKKFKLFCVCPNSGRLRTHRHYSLTRLCLEGFLLSLLLVSGRALPGRVPPALGRGFPRPDLPDSPSQSTWIFLFQNKKLFLFYKKNILLSHKKKLLFYKDTWKFRLSAKTYISLVITMPKSHSHQNHEMITRSIRSFCL